MAGSSIPTSRFCVCFGLVVIWFGQVVQAEPIDFVHDIVPVLQRNCVHCHGGREAEGDFSLNTRAIIVDSGHVDLESPEDSYLLELVTSADTDIQMPPTDRPRMSEPEIALVRRWIKEGMKWDADFTFAIQSYEPPLRPRTPELPAPRDGRDHPIDRILDEYLARNAIARPNPIDDATFLRRVSLDLIGMLPTDEQLDAFLADSNPLKRSERIDALLDDEIGYSDHWITFFNDLLRNDYSGTGFITGGRQQVSTWLYASLRANKPFDVMARELISPPSKASQGYIDGIKWRGEVSAGQTLPIQFSQSISQSFLGINMKCASCHDSFIDRWTLHDAYGLAAIYADESLELHRCDKPIGETAKATWLFPEIGQVDPSAPRSQRLEQLANLMTHPENGRFARTIVNRLWYQLMGRGIVHPLDAMQSEPWNEDLLDFLAVELVKNQYDLKFMLRLIATSAAYQSETEVASEQALGDDYVYRGPRSKRMTAEQFIDNVWHLTGSAPKRFDAPVVRGVIPSRDDADSQASGLPESNGPELTAKWIWGPLENGVAPGGQSVVLRKTFELPAEVVSGGAIVTCDNGFDMYVNNRWVSGSQEWTRPEAVPLRGTLKKGANTIVVIAKNFADVPNAAGFFFQAHLNLSDRSTLSLPSDESWEFNPNVPTSGEHKLGQIRGPWHGVSVVPALSVWENVINQQGRPMLAEVATMADAMPMVRASLMKNTALMKSLGRPMREQIVSMRPDLLTTLEAIDLANESTLADAFADGAKRLIDETGGRTDSIVRSLFRRTLTRQPTDQEFELLRSVLGDRPDQTAVQDAMWAVCMLPEFILIR
ncbi:DUF1549 domain-containing protein [Neorhodopirellula pilleata]|uniref:Planctomycete cytochrome C n=1 Tax=Neorhodopirellula pilleata TaxID=2714738 RepID=A0A5C6AYN4_9BACT|nr:DUF1549 domain-containing protein [Neorhodopirellula pilleata]TWU03254.1 Planctomycete cytochrome C [Neorhodopirellula pilleata]